jgi:Uma2 family endonuclease
MTSTLNLTQSLLDDWESIEPPMESDEHRDQLDLLITCLRWWWRHRTDVYISSNTTIFYHPSQTPQGKVKSEAKGSDFYVVLGASPPPRSSWQVWKEQDKYPDLTSVES